jgi:hypothetical protein
MKIVCSFFLVLILSACQNAWLAELVTRPGEALYRDDFSDPVNGWPQSVSENGTLGYADNTYQMLVQSAGYDLRAVSGQVFGNVRIEVDATRLAGPMDNRFGLICHFQDMNNYYVFIISSDGYYAIGKIRNGAAILLGQEMMAYSAAILQGSGSNHLRFDCVGDSLTGYVNGQLIAITNDADFSSGDAGLIAGAFDETGVYVSFDNFLVIKP